MGWRERDYAKFTDQEFAAIYGGSRGSGGAPPPIDPRGTGAVPSPQGRPRSHSPRRGLGGFAGLIAVAVIAVAAFMGLLIATGQVQAFSDFMNRQTVTLHPGAPRIPVFPAVPLPIEIPPSKTPKTEPHVGRIVGTRLLRAGTTMKVSGTHTPMDGSIVIRGRWNASTHWVTFGVARGSSRSYALAVPLTQRGVLRIRIEYPDGYKAVGTYRVE